MPVYFSHLCCLFFGKAVPDHASLHVICVPPFPVCMGCDNEPIEAVPVEGVGCVTPVPKPDVSQQGHFHRIGCCVEVFHDCRCQVKAAVTDSLR